MLAERVAAALAEVRAMAGSVLWVTHAGVAKAAAAHHAHREGWQTRLGFGEWLVLPAAGPEAESRTPRPRR
jgi:broad specificity phosphatase PhoE